MNVFVRKSLCRRDMRCMHDIKVLEAPFVYAFVPHRSMAP